MALWHFARLLLGALRLDEGAFQAALPSSAPVALITVTLAGLASALGQSVVLFINRVRPRRFIATLLIASALYVAIYLLWALSIWGIVLLFTPSAPFARVARAVGLGYAPQLLAFLVFIPFFGMALDYLLRLWTLLAVTVGVHAALELLLWQAFVCCALGYLLLELGRRTVGYPLASLADRLRARAAGVAALKTSLQPADVIAEALNTLPLKRP